MPSGSETSRREKGASLPDAIKLTPEEFYMGVTLKSHAVFEEWAKKDPVERFEKFLATRGLWDAERGERLRKEAMDEVQDAARKAEAVGAPPLESIFTDVYADVPDHIRAQGAAAFELAKRLGDPAAGDGAFPL